MDTALREAVYQFLSTSHLQGDPQGVRIRLLVLLFSTSSGVRESENRQKGIGEWEPRTLSPSIQKDYLTQFVS